METNEQFNLLRQKIEQINSAIFFNDSESALRLPSSIIQDVYVDDYGFIWFFAEKLYKTQMITENTFPARLEFYRKQVNFQVQVDGNATIVHEAEALKEFSSISGWQAKDEGMCLVKMRILQAYYRDMQQPTQGLPLKNWWQALKEYFGYLPQHQLRKGYVSL